MLTDIGEYLVGAYLRLVEKCDFVNYNVRAPGGKRDGLNELDVLGINLQANAAYLCEVTTHIRGLLYRNNLETVRRVKKKHKWQRTFAGRYLPNFTTIHHQFWSPVVPVGALTTGLAQIENEGLELVINGTYRQRVQQLRELARREACDTQNPVFRVLQILEHLRDG
jgi:hypothetical protein